MDDLISITPTYNGYTVCAYNGVIIGQFYQEVDGYYVLALEKRSGYIPSEMLRALADKLDELNKEWDDTIQNDPRI